MRYYVVFVDGCQWNNTFIVKANNKKEAINIVWSDFIEDDNISAKKNDFAPTLKKELSAEKLDDMFDSKDSKFFIIH